MSDRWFQLSQLLVAKKNGRETCKRHLGPVSNAARRPTPSRSTASWVSVKRKMVKTSSTIKLINKINSDLKIGIFKKKYLTFPSDSVIFHKISGLRDKTRVIFFTYISTLFCSYVHSWVFSESNQLQPTSILEWINEKKNWLICFYFIKDQ